MSDVSRQFVLQLKCPDAPGILAALTSRLHESGCDIREAAQFGDPETALFFVRMHIRAAPASSLEQLQDALEPVVRRHHLQLRSIDLSVRPRTLIAVSQHGHCLNDLLHRWHLGTMPTEVVGIVSNHETFRSLADWYGLPFHHLPVTPASRKEQEHRLLALVESAGVDLVVLARYMQVLSPETCEILKGRCINIHHSFLPGFKGAKPYHQAHARGVKLIGATAHYVTTDLDEGPIIEQDVRRVTHATPAEEMVEIGRETEASVLSRAVRWHLEHRVVLNGQKTVVFQ
jgi:formyltetrahydrofolate deformylase